MFLASGRSERPNIFRCRRLDTESQYIKARCNKYLKCKGTEENTDIDNLKQLFGGGDPKNKSVSKSVGIVGQIEILSGLWQCNNPEKLTAYNEQYKL